MIPYDSWGVIGSAIFFIATKFSCYYYCAYISMHSKRHHLTSIPEHNESEEENAPHSKKFVSKNKHEVLKAKYKCLKKLFQVYDASIIGILPTEDNHYEQGDHYSIPEEPRKHSRRRKTYRAKVDASACTNDITLCEKDSSIASSAAATVKRSCSTQMVTEHEHKSETESEGKSSNTIIDDNDPNFNYPGQFMPNLVQNINLQHLMMDAPRKLTRFQSFIHRLFGIRREKAYINPMTGHIYATSDNNIAHGEKRRRTGLRFRRLRKAKKVQSEIQLRDCPAIMQYVQSVQRHCLLDRTPRQCPITGCNTMFYGIINYNDHLNLCHFNERKYPCHYCHEGFEAEPDKYVHENEHLGISKLKNNLPFTTTYPVKSYLKKTSVTQTDPAISNCTVPEDKLKKIVSFFDKIVDSEQIFSEMKNNRYSETNLQSSKIDSGSVTGTESTSDKRTVSCVNLLSRKTKSQDLTDSTGSEMGSKCPCSMGIAKCHFCGEEFDNRRQLNLHVEFEHGIRDKFRKLHSCAGVTDRNRVSRSNMVKLKTGKINIQSNHQVAQRSSILSGDTRSEISRNKSEDSLSYDPSTNIVYSDSIESIKKLSISPNNRSSITTYRWEPGTKIIRI